MLGVAAATEQLLMEIVLHIPCERLHVCMGVFLLSRGRSITIIGRAVKVIQLNQSRVVRNKTKP